MREELGDVLLQVAFHARVAAESPTGSTSTTSPTSWWPSSCVGTPTCSADAGRRTSPASRRLGGDQEEGEAAPLADRGRLDVAVGRCLGRRPGRPRPPGRPAHADPGRAAGRRPVELGEHLLGVLAAADAHVGTSRTRCAPPSAATPPPPTPPPPRRRPGLSSVLAGARGRRRGPQLLGQPEEHGRGQHRGDDEPGLARCRRRRPTPAPSSGARTTTTESPRSWRRSGWSPAAGSTGACRTTPRGGRAAQPARGPQLLPASTGSTRASRVGSPCTAALASGRHRSSSGAQCTGCHRTPRAVPSSASCAPAGPAGRRRARR